jgi:hypothetical protein
MPFQTFVSSPPATQANSTPLTGRKPASYNRQSSEDAKQRASLLEIIDKLEVLPAFRTLPSDGPLRLLLTPFLIAVRARLSCATPAPVLLESLISDIDKKVTPKGQATYAQIARKGVASGAPPPLRPIANTQTETPRESKQLLIKISSNDALALKTTPSE